MTRPVPHARDRLPDQQRTGRRNTQTLSLRDFSRCCCCCCLPWSACGHAVRLDAIRTKPHRFLVLLQTAHDYPTPVSCHYPAAECTPLLCCATLPKQTNPRQGAHGWRPCDLSRNVQTCFPSFPITRTSAYSPTSCSSCC